MLTDDKELQASATDVTAGVRVPDTEDAAGTEEDRKAMRRLGKQQVFQRNFGFFSIFGFALILMGTWESLLGTIALALGNGGPSGLLYTYLACYLGFGLVVASMAEMASMAPTSGGQYHWVSEFAPKHIQKQVSYLIGWLSVLGYQVGVTISGFIAALMIQGLVILNYPQSYTPQKWHGTLIAVALICFVAFFNIFLAKHLPLIESVILVLHLAGWVTIVAALWATAPKSSNTFVWATFLDSGWGSTGVSTMVGFITSAGAFVGGDAPVHMAEELKNAPKTLPRAMIWTISANGAMGLVMLITFLYTLGDITAALESPTGFPIIEVFYSATGSVDGASALTSILIVLGIAANLTNMAGASRQMFAFARDRGLPAHKWISRVSHHRIPVNAILVSSLIAIVLDCINIGSSIAFNIILSIGSVALISSYFTSIACVTWRRVRGLPLLETQFSLGRAGIVVNVLSLCFLALTFVFCFFPPVPDPSLVAMNWAIVVYGGVLLLAMIYYFIDARHHYDGPVEYVRKNSRTRHSKGSADDVAAPSAVEREQPRLRQK